MRLESHRETSLYARLLGSGQRTPRPRVSNHDRLSGTRSIALHLARALPSDCVDCDQIVVSSAFLPVFPRASCWCLAVRATVSCGRSACQKYSSTVPQSFLRRLWKTSHETRAASTGRSATEGSMPKTSARSPKGCKALWRRQALHGHAIVISQALSSNLRSSMAAHVDGNPLLVRGLPRRISSSSWSSQRRQYCRSGLSPYFGVLPTTSLHETIWSTWQEESESNLHREERTGRACASKHLAVSKQSFLPAPVIAGTSFGARSFSDRRRSSPPPEVGVSNQRDPPVVYTTPSDDNAVSARI